MANVVGNGGKNENRKKGSVPVVLIIDSTIQSIIGPYCNTIINTLQTLHPNMNLLITSLTPTSHALTTHPFVSPAAFIASLPSLLRRPSRPHTTLWRSSCGFLRAIKTARRLLEGVVGGAGIEGKGSLPRYVVVISATDLENDESNDIWLEEENPDDLGWEATAKEFTTGVHLTSLLSVISLGYTPNLETFWRLTSSRFPQHLVYSSLNPPQNMQYGFPLYSPSHSAFLVGFYNHQARPAAASSSLPSVTTIPPQKRAAPIESTATAANKKVKIAPAASTVPPLVVPAVKSTPNLPRQPTVPTPPMPPQQRSSPAVPTPPLAVPNENLQKYISDMNAAAARVGAPQPTLQDIQNALATYTGPLQNNPSSTFLTSQPNRSVLLQQQQQQQQLQQQQQQLQQQQQQLQNPNQLNNFNPNQPTPLSHIRPNPEPFQPTAAQIESLPPIPADLKAKIDVHIVAIRQQVAEGTITMAEAQNQMKKLQDLANTHRFGIARKLAQDRLDANRAAAAVNNPNSSPQNPNQQAQQRARVPPIPSSSNYVTPTPEQYTVSPNNSNYQLNSSPQTGLAPAQAPQGGHRSAAEESTPVWRGAITWTIGESSGTKQEVVIYCTASPMQSSAIKDLSEVQFPSTLHVSQVVPIKMTALQELAMHHILPAVLLKAIPNDGLPKELADKQNGMGANGNEGLYSMFAQSMEHRGNCGIVKFSNSNNFGMVMISMPKQSRFIGIVFTKIEIPDHWCDPNAAASLTSASSLQLQAQQQQSQPTLLPNSLQQQQQQQQQILQHQQQLLAQQTKINQQRQQQQQQAAQAQQQQAQQAQLQAQSQAQAQAQLQQQQQQHQQQQQQQQLQLQQQQQYQQYQQQQQLQQYQQQLNQPPPGQLQPQPQQQQQLFESFGGMGLTVDQLNALLGPNYLNNG